MRVRIRTIQYAAAAAILLIAGCLAGCQQETASPVVQVPEQRTYTVPETRQYQKEAGSVFNITAYNLPAPTSRPSTATIGAVSKADSQFVDAGDTAKNAGAKYEVNQTININIGNQTPTLTGTTTATGTATQTPSQTATASPVQTVTPEFTSAVPITVGLPGSAVSGQATAAGSGGKVDGATANPVQTPTYTALNVPTEYVGQLLPKLLEWLFAIKNPTTQPQ